MTLLHTLVALFVVLSIADAVTTLRNLKVGGSESNPLLGRHPKPATVIVFAVVTSAAVVAVAYLVAPVPGPASLFVGILTAARAYAVIHNLRK
jgi:hypothetical protein